MDGYLIHKSKFDALSFQLALGSLSLENWRKQFIALSHNIHKFGTPEAVEEASMLEAIIDHDIFCADKEYVVNEVRRRVNFTSADGCDVVYAISKEATND